jgi:hypothetical protein
VKGAIIAKPDILRCDRTLSETLFENSIFDLKLI